MLFRVIILEELQTSRNGSVNVTDPQCTESGDALLRSKTKTVLVLMTEHWADSVVANPVSVYGSRSVTSSAYCRTRPNEKRSGRQRERQEEAKQQGGPWESGADQLAARRANCVASINVLCGCGESRLPLRATERPSTRRCRHRHYDRRPRIQ